jgi:Zn-dependent protease with chaperone function
MLAVIMWQGLALAQTAIKLPKNKFTPEQDVELGLKAAAEVRKQYPVIHDEEIAAYLSSLGERLVAAAPADLNQKVYRYSFTPVNVKEINAFALPGGPMFVNRGMFDAAGSEGEVVGVMAHELSHVLLRHGTANVTKSQNPWLQLGQAAGVVGGSMVGGGLGSAIATGTDFGLGTLMLRYSRDFEKQADLLGVQIMARAGYDPRDLGRMFETIERKSSGGSPQWMSSHPNPGNRTAYINQEAAALTIGRPADASRFKPMKARFAALPAAKPMAEVEKSGGASGGSATSVGTPGRPVPSPSPNFTEFAGGKVFQASVPENWTKLSSKNAIKAVPENGYGDLNGEAVFTHGVEFGVTRAASRDLAEATDAFVQSLSQNNPELRVAGNQQSARISGRTALLLPLQNPSPLGGRERITVTTVFLAEGTLFYYLTIAPDRDAAVFEPVFRRIGQSIRLTEVR